jgi:hypothetical protein
VLTAHALLGDDKIGLQRNNGIAHGLDLLLLDLQYPVPVLLFADLDVCLALALLVFERAVKQQDPGVLDSPPHLGVCNVLVQHDAVQHFTVLNLTAGDLLNARIALDVNLLLARADVERDGADSLERKAAHELRPPRDKLCANGRVDDAVHLLVIVDVDIGGNLGDDLQGVGKSLLEGLDDDNGVDVALELGQGLGEDFSR